jgi:hypothetical protein
MAANKEEVMKAKGSRRLVRWLGLALAVAALAAPSAQAVLAEGISGSPYSTEATNQTRLYADDLHGSVPASPSSIQSRLFADDRHESVPSSPVVIRSRLFADDSHALLSSQVADTPRGYAPINTRVRPEVPVVTSQAISDSSGFDWGDASIGGGIIFALVGFGAAVLAARQTRRSRLSAV